MFGPKKKSDFIKVTFVFMAAIEISIQDFRGISREKKTIGKRQRKGKRNGPIVDFIYQIALAAKEKTECCNLYQLFKS